MVAVAGVLALFTPLADPARLSVADQMRRLETGRVSAEAFDYAFLRFDAGRSGREALDSLTESDDPEIARRAAEAKALERHYLVDVPESALVIEVIPGSDPLPERFLTGVIVDMRATCLADGDCLAATQDLDGDGQAEWLVASTYRLAVYQPAGDGWREIGGYNMNACRPDTHDARELLRQGLTLTPSAIPDLTLGDARIPLTPNADCGA